MARLRMLLRPTLRQIADSRSVASPAHSSGRSIGAVLGGTVAGKAVLLALTPLLTRLYTPTEFGVYGVFGAISGIAAAYGALSYHSAIIIARDDHEAREVTSVARIAVGVTTLFGLALVLSVPGLGRFEFREHRVMVSAALCLGAVISFRHITAYWHSRKGNYAMIARGKVANPVVLSTSQAALFSLGPAGLIIGAFLGHLAEWAVLLRDESRRSVRAATNATRWQDLAPTARKFVDFPLYKAPQRTVTELAQGAPVMMLMLLASPAIAGVYVLGDRLVRVPYNMLANSMKTVFYPEVSRAYNESPGEAYRYTLVHTKIIAYLALPVCGALWIALPLALEVVFGEQWIESVPFMRALLLSTLGGLVARPAIASIPILRMQGQLLVWDAGRSAVALALFAGGLYWANPVVAVYLFSTALMVSYLLLTVRILAKLSVNDVASG